MEVFSERKVKVKKPIDVEGVVDEKKWNEFLDMAFKYKPGGKPGWMLWWCPTCDDLAPVEAIGEDPEKGWFIECSGDHEPKRFWAREMKK